MKRNKILGWVAISAAMIVLLIDASHLAAYWMNIPLEHAVTWVVLSILVLWFVFEKYELIDKN